ncbi:TIGR00341 family protein [Acidithiobacillus sp.]|uniref:TIGR00341 family protein n=1 Tax=Acidithiobacillus sp. TaxID=1872118 RepID=UPI0025C1AAE0|nr:TIGR00341 family protein [Acidithiobacillus sp.]
MALRLIEMVLQEKDGAELRDLLKEHQVLEHRQLRLPDGEVLVRILLDAERNEAVLDLLENRYTGEAGNRVVVLPVEATLPRAEPKPEPETTATLDQPSSEEKPSGRIGREELYEDIKDAAECSRVYLAMVVLSTIVAAIGLYYNSVAIIIGAMVIAPLLGPNMALALATTLGDLTLLRRALLTALTGIAMTMVLSVIIGVLLQVDPATPEIASRNGVGLGDITVALASGAAGALAFTTGVSTTLIGVMVAVALLPPLVAFGLLLGGGHAALAMGALSLFLMNLICVNLAGVTTFLVQGIRPATWWEKDRAVKSTRIAIVLWAVLLAGLVGMIVLWQKG